MSDFTRRINIYINDKQANKSLNQLAADSKRLTEELAKTSKGTADFIKKSAELKKVESQYQRLETELNKFTAAGKSLESLTKRQEELQAALKGDLGSAERKKLLKELDQVNRDYLKLDKILNGVEASGEASLGDIRKAAQKLRREIESGTLSVEEMEQKYEDLRKVNGILDDHRKKYKGINESTGLLNAGLGKVMGLAAGAFAVENLATYGKKLFALSAEMEVFGAKAETVFGTALPMVDAAARANANTMGMTISSYTDAATAIGDLLIPMGFTRQEAATTSTELVNLSGALSEWTAGKFTAVEVSEKLSKAMLGEREELKSLGISISEEDIKLELKNRKMEHLTGNMLQQAKAAITLDLITKKSVDAQTAYTEGAGTLVRRKAELQAKTADLSEKLATALFPAFERMISMAADVASGVVWMADSFNALINPAQSARDAFYQQTAEVENLESTLPALLDRYHELSAESNLSETAQQELSEVISKIADITPSAITEVDEYAEVLGISAEKAQEFMEAQRENLALSKELATEQTNIEIEKLEARQKELKAIADTGKEYVEQFFNIGDLENISDERRQEVRQELLETTQNLISAQAELERLQNDGSTVLPTEDTKKEEDIDRAAELRRASRAEKAAKDREKEEEREAKDLERKLQRLQEITEQYSEENRLSLLSEEDRAMEELRAKYDEQIETARELEAQKVQGATEARLQLELQKEQALVELQEQQHQERLARDAERANELFEAELERDRAQREAKQVIEDEIAALVQEELIIEQQNALDQLEAQQQELLAMAEGYGIDTLAIEVAYRKKKAKIQKDFQKKEQKDLINQQKAQAEALAGSFNALGSIVSSALQLVGEEGKKSVALNRVLTLAQIGFSAAEGVAKAIAAGAGLVFPANLGAIAAGVGAVLGGIAQAKSLLTQKKRGGWHDVIGEDDGRTYRAQYIGYQETGMLPAHPVVLASEEGPEYFVSNRDLQNPVVVDHVRAIENIRTQRTTQFKDGGATAPLPETSAEQVASPEQAAASSAVLTQLAQVLGVMTQVLQRGIPAFIDDPTIVDINQRMREIQSASGGVI